MAAALTATTHLAVSGVTKRYGAATVLDGIDLAVEASELITLLGPSGCGKTTLLRVIAGLAAADRGEIAVAGRVITRLPPHKRNIGVVFQNYALFPHLSVRRNVGFGLAVQRRPQAEAAAIIERYLDLVHLRALADRPVSALSGGQQQRVALARALAVQPSVVLFDEALSALDRKLREDMQVELRRLLREIGATAIFVTHDQDEALTMSDRIAVMNRGRIEQYADPKSIYARPGTLFALDFIGQSCKLRGVVTAVPERGMVVVDTVVGPVRAAANFAAGSPVVLATRPEHLTLASKTGTDGTLLPGHVRQAVFHGARTMLHVMLGDAPVLVELPGNVVAPEAGAAVSLCWPLHGFVYPDPDTRA